MLLSCFKLLQPAFDGIAHAGERPQHRIVLVRASDVPTYVQHGGADLGVVGLDTLIEHGGEGLYRPLDLGVARCRMSVAAPLAFAYAAAAQQGLGPLDERPGLHRQRLGPDQPGRARPGGDRDGDGDRRVALAEDCGQRDRQRQHRQRRCRSRGQGRRRGRYERRR